MKKTLFIIFLFSIFYFLFSTPILAANLEVNFESVPLFPSTIIWYPGLSETRSITVKNNSGETERVAIEAINEGETGNLASVLEFKVLERGIERYNSSKTLKDFWSEGIVQLSDLEGRKDTTYDLVITFKSTAGNEYQGKEAKFDLKIGFYSEAEPKGFKEVVTVAGVAAPPVCTATAPASAPVLSVTRTGANSVSLAWTPVSPVTHYLIAYGTISGAYIYGNPNVGNVTNYTVGSLSGGTTYYFAVKGVNDCAPGPYSNEVSVFSVGAVVAGSPPGFVPILGMVTALSSEVEKKEVEAKIPGEVAGAEVERVCSWWWILLLLQAISQIAYYCLIFKRKIKQWWVFSLAISMAAFFTHEKLHQGYLPSRFCSYFWLLDLLILILSTSGYFWLKKEKK